MAQAREDYDRTRTAFLAAGVWARSTRGDATLANNTAAIVQKTKCPAGTLRLIETISAGITNHPFT